MAKYTHLIPQNTALPGAKKIAVYNPNGRQVGIVALGNLTNPQRGEKLYSFGALSDGHYPNDTSAEDYARALAYFHDELDLPFSIVCGDVTEHGTAEEWAWWRSFSADYPVYVLAGNHDGFGRAFTPSDAEAVTGHPFYYSFTHGDDIFIMLGCTVSAGGGSFVDGELQWLYETLEANRDKRCFVFFHIRPDSSSGNAIGGYKFDIYTGTETEVFESLLSHYPNVVFFHGHSHMKLCLQEKDAEANYKQNFGRHDIHIPSSTEPRNTDGGSIWDVMGESEGYVVDVYEKGIHLRGRDFVKGAFLPIASYWLDTTLKAVEAGTYTDETGTVKNAELKYRLHTNGTNYIVDGLADGSTGGVVAPVSYIDGIRVWEINENAFQNTDIRVVVLPETTGYLTSKSFDNCKNLETVTFKRTTAHGSFSMAKDIFTNCPNLTTINVPWTEGKIANAPWGATNATINYNYTE